eukprot:TRINITY_DN22950_c0_g2_i1.p2 TRINITY_DN22950_c0_g2~~TRINITY_DN22950_c0_g2_i1.p2  ORF type:complete len:142 (-),score=54.85 TRINITY_DN22950_c0_g2_i1:172-537(-)
MLRSLVGSEMCIRDSSLFSKENPGTAQQAWRLVCQHAASQGLGLVLSSRANTLFSQWHAHSKAESKGGTQHHGSSRKHQVVGSIYKLSSCFHCRQTKKSVPTRTYLSCTDQACPNLSLIHI